MFYNLIHYHGINPLCCSSRRPTIGNQHNDNDDRIERIPTQSIKIVLVAFDNNGVMATPPLFGLLLESKRLCLGRPSTQSNSLPIGRQWKRVFAWVHHLIQNGFHNHHPSPIPSQQSNFFLTRLTCLWSWNAFLEIE